MILRDSCFEKLTLTLPVGVRIPVPQPSNTKGFQNLRKPFFYSGCAWVAFGCTTKNARPPGGGRAPGPGALSAGRSRRNLDLVRLCCQGSFSAFSRHSLNDDLSCWHSFPHNWSRSAHKSRSSFVSPGRAGPGTPWINGSGGRMTISWGGIGDTLAQPAKNSIRNSSFHPCFDILITPFHGK